MRRPLTTTLFFVLGFINRASLYGFSEDSEESGYDPDGSGSGDWSDQGDINDTEDHLEGKTTAAKAGSGNHNTLHVTEPSGRVFNYLEWLSKKSDSEFIVDRKSQSLLENSEVLAGVLAGAIVGVVLAAMLAALLICRWQEKDNGGYVLGPQRA